MNIFNFTKPTAAPEAVVTPAVAAETTAPAQAKKGFFNSIVSPFAGSVITRLQKHQTNLVKMMPILNQTSDVLQFDVFNAIKGEDFTKLLGYQRDLNLSRADAAVESPTFAQFKSMLKPSLLDKIIKAGKSQLATAEGGIAHAEGQMNFKLLEAMRKAVDEALKGVNVSDAEKQSYLTNALNSIGEALKAATSKDVEAAKATKGAPVVSQETAKAVKEAEEAIQELEKNAVLGGQATKGEAVKKAAQIKAEIQKQNKALEQQAAEAEKKQIIEGVKGVYVSADDKLAKIKALVAQLEGLSDRDDSTIGKAKQIEAEKTEIGQQIVDLIKEINPESTFSIADLKNPTSKAIVKAIKDGTLYGTYNPVEEAINNRFQYEMNRIELISLKGVVEANKEFVAKLNDIHGKKNFFARAILPSEESKVLAQNSASIQRISTLEKAVKTFEAAQKAIADAKARAEANKGVTLFSRVTAIGSGLASVGSTIGSYFVRKPAPSALEKAEADFKAKDEAYTAFVTRDDVQAVLTQEQDLLLEMTKLEKKFFVRSSRRAEEQAKVQKQLEALRTEQASIFVELTTLRTAREESDVAFLAAHEASEAEKAKQAAALEAKNVQTEEEEDDVHLYL